MSTPVFTPPKAPAYGYSKSIKKRVKRADFGDGYSQRTGDGLNTLRRQAELTFTALSAEEADEIEAFLDARAGAESFEYTLPDETTARRFTEVPDSYSRVAVAKDTYDISLTLQEEFDL